MKGVGGANLLPPFEENPRGNGGLSIWLARKRVKRIKTVRGLTMYRSSAGEWRGSSSRKITKSASLERDSGRLCKKTEEAEKGTFRNSLSYSNGGKNWVHKGGLKSSHRMKGGRRTTK